MCNCCVCAQRPRKLSRRPAASPQVIIELDSRFLTELTHTAAMFAELFEPGGRKRLVKVWPNMASVG